MCLCAHFCFKIKQISYDHVYDYKTCFTRSINIWSVCWIIMPLPHGNVDYLMWDPRLVLVPGASQLALCTFILVHLIVPERTFCILYPRCSMWYCVVAKVDWWEKFIFQHPASSTSVRMVSRQYICDAESRRSHCLWLNPLKVAHYHWSALCDPNKLADKYYTFMHIAVCAITILI